MSPSGLLASLHPRLHSTVVQALRGICGERQVRFLYGGSAGPGTFEGLREGIDGLFLGRFGHDPEQCRDVISEVGG